MSDVHTQCLRYGRDEKTGYINYVKRAHIAGFMKEARPMMAQGIL